MIILGGGTIFNGISYYSAGIRSVSVSPLSLTPQELVNSQISPGLFYSRYPLNPYCPWSWGGFGNAGKDFWKFFYTSNGIDGIEWQEFIIGTFSIPIILGEFFYVSESLVENEVFDFQFLSLEYLNSFRLLFGVNAVQSIDSIVIKKSDLNVNTSTTAESLFVRIFNRTNLLLNENPVIFYQGKTIENQTLSYNYWFQVLNSIKFDEDNNIDPFSPIDLGEL